MKMIDHQTTKNQQPTVPPDPRVPEEPDPAKKVRNAINVLPAKSQGETSAGSEDPFTPSAKLLRTPKQNNTVPTPPSPPRKPVPPPSSKSNTMASRRNPGTVSRRLDEGGATFSEEKGKPNSGNQTTFEGILTIILGYITV